jgi:hypothetical protein
MTSNIPKFTSFRPKPKPATEPPKDEPRKPEIPSKEKARNNRRSSPRTERDRRQDSAPSKSYSRDDKPRKERSRDGRRDQSSRTEHDREPNSALPKSCFSDRRGDPGVLKYGSLNRYEIPAYRRHGYGCILGLSADRKIDRENSTEKQICTVSKSRKRQERLLTKKHASRESSRSLRLIKTDQSGADIDRDFISLSRTRKRKRADDTADEDSGDEHAPELDYRGIKDTRTSAEPVDPDTHYESDTQDMSASREVTKRNSELVRMTREQPQNLQAWKDLVDHQEAMMKLDRSASELSTSDKQLLADVRISTYEEALRKTVDNQTAQIELYLGLMHEARRHWDETKLANKWQDVLAKHPHSTPLWLKYLDFFQSSFSRFKYEDCKRAFLRCIKGLQTSSEIQVEDTLHIFIRLTSMIHEAGYQELALALWQSILHYNFLLSPADSNSLQSDLKRRLMEFWESELPRIGELGSGDLSPSPDPAFVDMSNISGNTFEKFESREAEHMNQLRYPGRSSDELGEDDPFHIIFLSDLEEYLQIISSEFPRTLLIQAFLCFCRLPPLPQAAGPREQWWSDPLLQRRAVRSSDRRDGTTGFSHTLGKYSNVSLQSCRMTSELLIKQDFSLEDVRLDAAFVRRLLKTLATDASTDETVGEYLLAFELKHFPGDAPKTAKNLLKTRPTSLRLYNAYGLVESGRGNSARADQVFSIALSMQKGEHALSTSESLELFSCWIWEAMQKGDSNEALWRLTSPQGRLPARGEHQLQPEHDALERARKLISATSERALLSQNYPSAVLSTSLLALLLYLSSNLDLEAALATHRGLSAWFSSHKLTISPWAELQAQSICRFLAHHTVYAPIVKPALIRTTLEPLIVHFPNNTILLSLFAANEARFSLDDRVRGIMHQTALQRSEETSVAGWAFAIHHETLKGEIAGSTAHSIRALYIRATDSTGAHCPALWHDYFCFEIEQLGKERARRPDKVRKDGKKSRWEGRVDEAEQRLKETFYAGLKKLPWCKEFVMLVFKHARDVFGEEELWRVYHVMVEKELRLYIELDDSSA